MLPLPIVREDELLGLVTVVDPADGGFGSDDVETLSGLAVQAGVAIENARLHRVVEQQAVTDALTGLANRRQFFDALGRELERAQRFEQETALILFDLDDFKQSTTPRPPGRRRRAAQRSPPTSWDGPRDRRGRPVRGRGVRGAAAPDRS